MELSFEHDSEDLDPMELVEAVMAGDDRFTVSRDEDGDVQFNVMGAQAEAAGQVSWRGELPAVLFTLAFPIQAPKERMDAFRQLAALINENLWLGHFDIWSDDGGVVFRHAIAMIGRSELMEGEVHAMMAACLDAADRLQPAFALLLANPGCSPEDAADAALLDVVGEA